MEKKIEVTYAGTIKVIKSNNFRTLYEHQKEAIKQMDQIDKKDSFSSLLVLPTGGGKTVTAVIWILRKAINQKKKVLWIAHRHLLLEQAADTFQRNSFLEYLPNIKSFNYRIISGKHDRLINIRETDDVLIVSKDSINRNINLLDSWLKNQNDIYIIIDEAHHATAKTYRKVINYVNEKVSNCKLLGLTATPFRTNSNERGLLAKIFKDGIVYKIALKELIKKGILSVPIFEECKTSVKLGDGIGIKTLKNIQQLDNLPDDIADYIAQNKERNNIIVKRFLENKEKYGKTLIFAVNRIHAFALKGLFAKNGIHAEVVVSGTKAEFIGIDISNKENERNINDYKLGKIDVLINVNILTEGVDLPETKTVFLTRPTVSSILMTQMIGRALRGEKAGGTKEAYIVSFIDDWKEKIAWVNPKLLLEDESEFEDRNSNYKKRNLRLISISIIEQFAKIVDDTIDTSKLENIDFIERIPIGMYLFSYIDDNKIECNHQVIVYNSTKEQYDKFINDLLYIFEKFKVYDEIINDKKINKMVEYIHNTYFIKEVIPSYDSEDIINILKYYAQKECIPTFVPFDETYREKLDLGFMASEIIKNNMRRSELNEYIDNIWNDDDGVVRTYFGKKYYFRSQLGIEIRKLLRKEKINKFNKSNVEYEKRELSKLTLDEILKIDYKYGREIKENIFSKYQKKDGNYYCKNCGFKSKFKSDFQIDHIKPMAKGGRTIVSNLQLLCVTCNMKKGDKYDE